MAHHQRGRGDGKRYVANTVYGRVKMNPRDEIPNRRQFSVAYLLSWIAIFAFTIACLQFTLRGTHGWLIGYPNVIIFSVAILLATILICDPIRRLIRWSSRFYIVAFCLVVASTGGLIAYAQSFVPILIERGIAEPDKIAFKKLTLSKHGLIEIKYDVWDLPDCEITAFVIPWRDAGRSLSDDYLSKSSRR